MTQDISEQEAFANPDQQRCQFTITQGDITQQDVDSIFSVIRPNLEIEGRLNKHIFQKAGDGLDDYILENITEPQVESIFSAPAFDLNSKYILFSVIPFWRTDLDIIDKHLIDALHNLVETSQNMGLASFAIPPLCCGHHGYPAERGIRLIIRGVLDRIDTQITKEVKFVSLEKNHLSLFKDKLEAILAESAA